MQITLYTRIKEREREPRGGGERERERVQKKEMEKKGGEKLINKRIMILYGPFYTLLSFQFYPQPI